jgi:RNA polymerase sigma-70 factor (TIGR02943 family)
MKPNEFAEDVAAARNYLLRFARLQLRNDAWSEDVVSETMLAALEKPGNFHGKSTLNTWLVGILKYKIIDCIRANKREVASSINTDEDSELEDLLFIPDGHFKGDVYEWLSPESELNSKQFLAMLDVCIAEMPTTMGRVFLMREWMEFSTEEICKELKLSTSNVWVLLHRARLRLRECLQIQWFGGIVVSASKVKSRHEINTQLPGNLGADLNRSGSQPHPTRTRCNAHTHHNLPSLHRLETTGSCAQ